MVKMSLAKTSNQLDLSDCELETVPDEVLQMADLEVSSSALHGDLCHLVMMSPLKCYRFVVLSQRYRHGSGDTLCRS